MGQSVGTGLRYVCDLGLTELDERLSDQLEPGDVIVAKTVNNALSRLIGRLDGWWTHTAISLGGDRIAHAQATGVTVDSLAGFIAHYGAGLAVARPGYDRAVREAAAAEAERIATTLTTEYHAGDLGVAFSLLRRAQAQPGLQELLQVQEDGREMMGRSTEPPDFASTCSGFVYRCYFEGAGQRLAIEPAPGIRISDNGQFLDVPDRDDLLDELQAARDGDRENTQLRDRLTGWRTMLGITIGGVRAGIVAMARDQPVPIEQGVTPMDLFLSPDHVDRWLIRGRDRILAATVDCGRFVPPVDLDSVEASTLTRSIVDVLEGGDDRAIAAEVSAIVERVRTAAASPQQAVQSAVQLQGGRRFDEVIRVAEGTVAVLGFDATPLELLRRSAQAEIEAGHFSAAHSLLERLDKRLDLGTDSDEDRDRESHEVRGLLGRIAKQRYVEFGTERDLHDSVQRYQAAFDGSAAGTSAEHNEAAIWHGGNLLALADLAERRRISIALDGDDVASLRADLEARIGDDDQGLGVFIRGTLIETLLSRGDAVSVEQATHIAKSLAADAKATAFELASLRRQVHEIWGYTADHEIIQHLDGGALDRGDGEVRITNSAALQKMLGKARPIVHQTLARAVGFAPAVCMVTTVSGSAHGTGFVVPGGQLHASLGSELVLMTNNHVTSTKPYYGRTALPNEVRARFELIPGPYGRPLIVGGLEEIWTDGPLDVTILSLQAPEPLRELEPIQVAPALPRLETDDDPHVFVIGHPQGQQLSYSVRGNELLDVGDKLLHYLAPTEEGSSGSPVFNEGFELIGLHHAGSHTMPTIGQTNVLRPANEASTITAIVEALDRHLGPAR